MVDQDTRAVDAVLRQYGVFRGHPSRRSELAREVLERGWSEELVASEAERILRSYDSQGDVLVAPKVLVAHLRTADPDAVREDQAVFEQTLERIRRESAPRPQTSRGTATGMPDHYQLGYVTNPLVRILGLTPPLSDDEIRQAASDPRITGSLEQLAWFAHRSVSAVAEALGKSA